MKKATKNRKIFLRYLKENNLYEKFIKNVRLTIDTKNICSKTYYDFNINDFFNDKISTFNFRYTPLCLFPWSITPQGDSFWMKYYRDWVNKFPLFNKTDKKEYTISRKRIVNGYRVIRK